MTTLSSSEAVTSVTSRFCDPIPTRLLSQAKYFTDFLHWESRKKYRKSISKQHGKCEPTNYSCGVGVALISLSLNTGALKS